jgi:hypothetical protein
MKGNAPQPCLPAARGNQRRGSKGQRGRLAHAGRIDLSMTRRVLLLSAILLCLTACVSFYEYRNVKIVVRNVATGAPMANTTVFTVYPAEFTINPAPGSTGVTDAEGCVVIRMPDWRYKIVQAKSTRVTIGEAWPAGTYKAYRAQGPAPRPLPLGSAEDPDVSLTFATEVPGTWWTGCPGAILQSGAAAGAFPGLPGSERQ